MQISIIIPVFNEIHRLPDNLIATIDYLKLNFASSEIIVVEDGSGEPVEDYIKSLPSTPGVELRYLSHYPNRGKGYSVKSGILESRGEYAGFLDADGSTPMAEMNKLANALRGGADIAIGSRAKPSSEREVEKTIHRFLMGSIFTMLVKLFTGVDVFDSQCGFKLMKGDVARSIFSELVTDGFVFDVEMLARAKKQGMRIDEIPVNWHDVSGSKVNLIADSIRMVKDLIEVSKLIK